MNFQFYHELDDWLEDHDKLIMSKNIVGTVHKKLFYADGKIQCVLRRNGVVINDNVEKIQDAPRVTDEIEKFWWQVEEKVRLEEWEKITLSPDGNSEFAEKDKLNMFYEQIRREDLDGDGYPEPYVITVHKETKQVVRITANYTPESITFKDLDGKTFDPTEYANLEPEDQDRVKDTLDVVRIDGAQARIRYVKYEMIPSWEGGYWSFGYGIMLGPLNDNCNKLVNHLLNAGELANKGGGFINSGIKMGSGELRVRSNEWKKVQSPGMDLSRNIVPYPVKEPSQTLFSLLGLLMDVLKELSSVTEVMSGEQPKANMPYQSIAALIEQGKKMFNAVYIRHYRSLNKEQNALFDLNFLYQDPAQYIELLDEEIKLEDAAEFTRADFSREGIDILPTANPEFSSKLQRMSQSQALYQMREDPNVNATIVTRMFVEAITDDVDVANEIVPEQPNLTPEQAKQQAEQQMQQFRDSNEAQTLQAKAQIAQADLKKAQIELQMKVEEAKAQGVKLPMEVDQKVRDAEKTVMEAEQKAIESRNDVRVSEANAEKAEIETRKAEVEAEKAAALLPLEIEKAQVAVDKEIASKDKIDFTFKAKKSE
jgi:hypothetical protein